MSTSNANPGSIQQSPRSAAVAATRGGGQSQRWRLYRGVRSRGRKWVSEIRERRKPGRIWLGTYPTPEMAAAAYDAASLALAWPNAALNFPNLASTYPIPASLSAIDIKIAAAAAAAKGPPPEPTAEPGLRSPDVRHGYVDEEELFDMPSLLMDMAEGMLMSPPPIICDSDSVQDFEGDSLWRY